LCRSRSALRIYWCCRHPFTGELLIQCVEFDRVVEGTIREEARGREPDDCEQPDDQEGDADRLPPAAFGGGVGSIRFVVFGIGIVPFWVITPAEESVRTEANVTVAEVDLEQREGSLSHTLPLSRRPFNHTVRRDVLPMARLVRERSRSVTGGLDRWLLFGPDTVIDMHETHRAFLDDLLATPSPSGFETASQRVWIDYVDEFADEVFADAYGNAVAVHEGSPDTSTIALTGHGDEIGFIIRDVLEEGFLRIAPIGGSDRTVSKGQHVTVHADEPVHGVVGQTAIHLRDPSNDEYEEITGQFVDIGATDADEALDHVEIGDPVTFSTGLESLVGDRIAGRGIDNRAGSWAAAEGLRRAAVAGVDATVYAVSTVQEEIGLRGARMIGFDLESVDAFVAVDVTHATDNPDVDVERRGPVELGAGPVITRGSANHPVLVEIAREAATDAGIDVQLQAAGSRTGTDADAFYTARGGVPSLNVSIPNRYMHTPVEVVDTTDLDDVADLLASIAEAFADLDSVRLNL